MSLSQFIAGLWRLFMPWRGIHLTNLLIYNASLYIESLIYLPWTHFVIHRDKSWTYGAYLFWPILENCIRMRQIAYWKCLILFLDYLGRSSWKALRLFYRGRYILTCIFSDFFHSVCLSSDLRPCGFKMLNLSYKYEDPCSGTHWW